MYISLKDIEDMVGGQSVGQIKKPCIILVTMSGCPYCHHMKPEWESFIREKEFDPRFDILEIERNMIRELLSNDFNKNLKPLSGITSFPSIVLKPPSNDKPFIEFKEERTKPKMINFVEKNLKGDSKKKPIEGLYVRGEKKGKLKKGFRFVDGKPVKTEKKTENKTEKKTEKKTGKKIEKKM